MASSKELKALITLAGKIDPSLQNAMLKASNESLKLTSSTKKTSSALSKLGDIAKGVFIGNLASKAVSFATGKLVELSKEGLNLASDLKEVQNVVDTTFGKNANQIDEWSKKALNGFGLSKLQAEQFNGTMGAMLKSSGLSSKYFVGMSENLSGLAGDFSSFYNIAQDDAFQKIRSGISGETEPLKQLGINMSVANLNAYALSKGIKTSYDKMDQSSQTLLRYGYLMSVSKDAQGDFAKTSGGFANQQRLLSTRLQDVAATIAGKFLPKLTELAQKLNDFLTNLDADEIADKAMDIFNKLGNEIQYVSDNANIFIPIAAGLVGAFTAFSIVSTVITAFRTFKEANEGATIARWALNVATDAFPAIAIAAGIGLVIAGGVALYKNWDTVSASASKLWKGIKGVFGAGVNWVIDNVNELIEKINSIPHLPFQIPLLERVDMNDYSEIPTSAFSSNYNYNNMPKHANGGLATEPTISGEAGLEMNIPIKRNARSLGLLNQTAQMLGVGADSQGSSSLNHNYFNININCESGNADEIADKTKKAIREIFEEFLNEKLNDDRRVSLG